MDVSCRACRRSSLVPVPPGPAPAFRTASRCLNCGTVQVPAGMTEWRRNRRVRDRGAVNPEHLYRTLLDAALEFLPAEKQVKHADLDEVEDTHAGLRDGDVVLDVGCRDGTLLSLVDAANANVRPADTRGDRVIKVGFDPDPRYATDDGPKSRLDGFVPNGFSAIGYGELAATLTADSVRTYMARLVTTVGVLDNSPDPNRLLADVATVLRDDGVFAADVTPLREVFLDGTAGPGRFADTNLTLLTLKSIQSMCDRAGLDLVDVRGLVVDPDTRLVTDWSAFRFFARSKRNHGPLPAGCTLRLAERMKAESSLLLDETWRVGQKPEAD